MGDQKTARRVLKWLIVLLFVVVFGGTWFAFDPSFQFRRTLLDVVAPSPEDEFQRRVRDYILNNPEVIIEAARRFEQRQRTAEMTEATSMLKVHADEIFRDGDNPIGRNPNGDTTLVEFFDYNCPYCRQVTSMIQQAEAADPQLRVVYKEFPILGPNSILSAKAALAIHRQGKYLAFHREMMLERGVADEAKVMRIAAKIGIEMERMKSDINDPTIVTMVERNLALARVLRISGTPSFVIGEQIVRGAIELKSLQALIRNARSKQSG